MQRRESTEPTWAGFREQLLQLGLGDELVFLEIMLISQFAVFLQGLKNQSRIKLNIVRCPPVTTVLIRRPDLRYQLGFSVQNGIVSSIVVYV